MRHAATLVLVLAAVLGAAGLYRYESTRTVACGIASAPIAVPVDANVSSWFTRVYPPSLLRDVQGVHVLRVTCQARLDAANGEAQGAYLAYAAFVAAVGGLMLARRQRRHP
jgi:hypothetical protein